PDQRARAQPGRALVRDPVRTDPARDPDVEARPDGDPRQQPADDRPGVGDGSPDHRAQRLPARADVRARVIVALAAGFGLTSLGVTATNPLTIALWTGGFAAAGAATRVHSGLPAAALLLGIGLGSLAWLLGYRAITD